MEGVGFIAGFGSLCQRRGERLRAGVAPVGGRGSGLREAKVGARRARGRPANNNHKGAVGRRKRDVGRDGRVVEKKEAVVKQDELRVVQEGKDKLAKEAAEGKEDDGRSGRPFYKDSLRAYMAEIRQFDMLKRSEELALAAQMKLLAEAEEKKQTLKQELGRNPTFTEWAAALNIPVGQLQKVIMEGTAAKQTLVSANLRLVNSVVNKHARAAKLDSSKIQDLMQEGVFGLIRAAEKYDANKGFKFSTYATYWVTSFTSRALQTIDRPVRIPAKIHETYLKMRKMHREHLKEHGTSPSEAELAAITGVTVPKMRFVISCVRQATVSTDIKVGHELDDSATLGELLESDENIAEELVDNMFRRDLDQILRRFLNPRERAALRLRFGLDDGGERTLKQISKALNLSTERTRQIIFNAMVKLRKREVVSEMKEYIPDVYDSHYSKDGEANGAA